MINIITQRLLKQTSKIILKSLKKLNIQQETSEYYFAYGANLNSKRFIDHSIPFEILGNACLKDHQISFSMPCEYIGKGFGNVTNKKNDSVWGKLFKISKPGLILLDILEWVPFNFYKREKVEISNNNGETFQAWVYKVINPDFSLIPPKGYLELIINKSSEANFPKNYIDHLKLFDSEETFELDHGFRLSNPKKRRLFEKKFKNIYKIHDELREKLSDII
jgi:gamma-glutamylcyclotransferase (GGCT)/AIG2-like uncharacterized protein YtfP